MPGGKLITALTPAERKRLGAWYTPPRLVEHVVARAMFPGARSVLDPACGDGRFLAATGAPEQTGIDIDPRTAFVHDDALTREWGDQTFDVVVGNPPFLAQRRAATRRAGPARFGGGPYADTAAEFLALAVTLARPGGRVGLVLPQSLLAARDAAPIRAMVDERAALRWVWWSETPMFDAGVHVWAGVWEVGGARGEIERCVGPDFTRAPAIATPPTWTGLIATSASPPSAHHSADGGPVLGDLATFTVGFRDQYYGLVGAVGDDVGGPPLVTSGLIEPGRSLWGSRPVRFAKQRFSAPRVDVERVAPRLHGWVRRQLTPKILIANQTRTIESVIDHEGEWLPSVPVISCFPHDPGDLERIQHALSSPAATEYVQYHAAGSGMSPGVVRLSPALLTRTPGV